nr:hypothetical protein [Saccharolobus solfataricus]
MNPICAKAPEIALKYLEVLDEIHENEKKMTVLKATIKRISEELKKEYGEGYITRKRVRRYRYPIFRSIERKKDYNLERNFPEYANVVNEFFATREKLKQLHAVRKRLDEFINTAYIACVPPDVRDPKKAYKRKRQLEDIAFLSDVLDQCDESDCKELKECNEFFVDARKGIIRCEEE